MITGYGAKEVTPEGIEIGYNKETKPQLMHTDSELKDSELNNIQHVHVNAQDISEKPPLSSNGYAFSNMAYDGDANVIDQPYDPLYERLNFNKRNQSDDKMSDSNTENVISTAL